MDWRIAKFYMHAPSLERKDETSLNTVLSY